MEVSLVPVVVPASVLVQGEEEPSMVPEMV